MNQLEQNRIAEFFIHNQSLEVANKLDTILTEDVKERVKQVPGPAVHHIHNMALFYAMVRINCLYQTNEGSKAESRQYIERAETLKLQFFDIVDSLKDFRPTSEKDENENPTDE
jgi:hypothetical protein